jgi:dolichyl-phosphate-mannose-protein mannosyltransferase
MQEFTLGVPPPPGQSDAPKVVDERVPVGMDAGSPEVTGAAHDDGGWHGGAEEGNAEQVQEGGRVEDAPRGAVVPGLEGGMGLDDEARRLVDEALRAEEGGLR